MSAEANFIRKMSYKMENNWRQHCGICKNPMSIHYHFVDHVLEGLLRPEVQVCYEASGRSKVFPWWSKLQNGGSCQFPFFILVSVYCVY